METLLSSGLKIWRLKAILSVWGRLNLLVITLFLPASTTRHAHTHICILFRYLNPSLCIAEFYNKSSCFRALICWIGLLSVYTQENNFLLNLRWYVLLLLLMELMGYRVTWRSPNSQVFKSASVCNQSSLMASMSAHLWWKRKMHWLFMTQEMYMDANSLLQEYLTWLFRQRRVLLRKWPKRRWPDSPLTSVTQNILNGFQDVCF